MVAVITGGSRGIGEAIGLDLASKGFDIAIVDIMNEAPQELMEKIVAMGQKATFHQCDVSDFAAVKAMAKTMKKEFGQIDVLVNNAGITRDNLVLRMTEEEFDQVININLKGAYNMIRHISPIMFKQRSGSIINMASVAGVYGNAGQANYSASKAGMIGMTKSLSKELGSRGIRVNAVAPGVIKTKMTDVLSDEIKEQMVSRISLGFFGEVQDIANAVGFLATDQSRYITGQTFVIDGGLSL